MKETLEVGRVAAKIFRQRSRKMMLPRFEVHSMKFHELGGTIGGVSQASNPQLAVESTRHTLSASLLSSKL